MRSLLTMLALAGLMALPALADQATGGISGQVVDIHTGQPVAHAVILYYRVPYLENNTTLHKLETDRNGRFSDITLEPGRYILMARVPNRVQGCAVDDVVGGETTRVKIGFGHDVIQCSGPRVHPAMIDPNATADVYRI